MQSKAASKLNAKKQQSVHVKIGMSAVGHLTSALSETACPASKKERNSKQPSMQPARGATHVESAFLFLLERQTLDKATCVVLLGLKREKVNRKTCCDTSHDLSYFEANSTF